MRRILATGVTALALAGGLVAAPSSAASLGPVGAVSVQPSLGNDGTAYVNVSWASEPKNADGALVCMHRGTTPVQTPNSCESRIVAEAPQMSSGLIAVHPGKSYTIEVFSYQATSPVAYGPPVSVLRHGVKVGMNSVCNSTTPGSTCRIASTVTDTLKGAALANRKVQLWMSKEKQPAKWSLVATRTTNGSGQASVTITIQRSRLYQWHYSAPHARELTSSSSRVDIAVS